MSNNTIILRNSSDSTSLSVEESNDYNLIKDIITEMSITDISVSFSISLFNQIRTWDKPLNNDNIQEVISLLLFLQPSRHIYNKVCYYLPTDYQELLTPDQLFILYKNVTIIPQELEELGQELVPDFGSVLGLDEDDVPCLYICHLIEKYLDRDYYEQEDLLKMIIINSDSRFIPRNIITKSHEYDKDELFREMSKYISSTGLDVMIEIVVNLIINNFVFEPTSIDRLANMLNNAAWQLDPYSRWHHVKAHLEDLSCITFVNVKLVTEIDENGIKVDYKMLERMCGVPDYRYKISCNIVYQLMTEIMEYKQQ